VLPANLIHLVAFAIGFSVITFLHVVFGELAPKTIAIAEAERLSLFVAPPMKFFYILFYPGLVVFNGTANAFTRLLGIPPASETEETLEEREIRSVLARSGEKGHVDTAEVEMIESVFDLDDTLVREVMVPRPDVVSVTGDTALPELRSIILDAGHTRYPVVTADEEEVIGFLDVKDILRASEAGEDATTTAADISREILVVPETTTASDLLLQFRTDQQQMAAVIDEWGTFEGIATIEDVVEAVVGDLRDEFDTDEAEPSIRQQGEGVYEVDGGVALSTVNDTLETDFQSEEYETVSGLILEQLDRAPEVDDSLEASGHTLTVTDVDGARIVTIRIERTDE
jgi:CBS domain containing-hemolysin-like protein